MPARVALAYLYADPDGILDAILEAKHDTGEQVGRRAVDRARVRDEIVAAQRELGPLITDATLKVYRAFTLDPSDLDRFEEGQPLGTAWSYEARGAHAYDGGAAHSHELRLTAQVSAHDVAWAETIAVHSGREAEIRLAVGAPVILIALCLRERRAKPGTFTVVRTDLIGQTLTA